MAYSVRSAQASRPRNREQAKGPGLSWSRMRGEAPVPWSGGALAAGIVEHDDASSDDVAA